MFGQAHQPLFLWLHRYPRSLNDVPLVIRGEEVGRVTVTARVWPRDELIQSRKKEVQGGFDPGGGLGVGGNGEGGERWTSEEAVIGAGGGGAA